MRNRGSHLCRIAVPAMELEHAGHDSTVVSLSIGASICLQCAMLFLCSSAELRVRKVQLIKELQMVSSQLHSASLTFV